MNVPLITLRSISKEFPGVCALSDVSLDLYSGEIHCIVGENGAGKSTLMKILSGAYSPTSGQIVLNNEIYDELDPETAQNLGIQIVYQENDLVHSMNAVENIFIGREKTKKLGFVDKKSMYSEAKKIMQEFDIEIDLSVKIENMSVSDQQFVKILKALVNNSRLLILDEPTSMFNIEDSTKVLELVKKIANQGISVVYISHFLQEVLDIADRITVLRDGVVVKTYEEVKNITMGDLTLHMVGRPIDKFYQRDKIKISEEKRLEVCDLKLNKNSPEVNFFVKKGEIVGIYGLVGSGRTEIVRTISGADRFYSGTIKVDGVSVNINSPKDGIAVGIAHITEDRQQLGLNLCHSVLENLLIVKLQQMRKSLLYDYKKQGSRVQSIIDKLKIRTPNLLQKVIYLSGGNQQKVVLGKWLITDAQIYIFDEPTRGIDINAKYEFYEYMTELVKQGKSVIMISSDMPEIISMSDRVLVVRDGSIKDEFTQDEINEQNIVCSALGVAI
ncbi:MAG: sugar ABC transporter ATP-binding protein [Clostridiaceae bacterium]|nr:sugar ABC transporter ATP-binding protein [Clostridiaceae bacterium]